MKVETVTLTRAQLDALIEWYYQGSDDSWRLAKKMELTGLQEAIKAWKLLDAEDKGAI